jgi:hypothetical protein
MESQMRAGGIAVGDAEVVSATVARTPRFCEEAGSRHNTRKKTTLGRVEPIRQLVT